MSHTPGPLFASKDTLNPNRIWGVVKLLSREACIEIDGDDSAYGRRTEVVAEVCAADNGQDEADAKLFAAAPDLLEACITLRGTLKRLQPKLSEVLFPDHMTGNELAQLEEQLRFADDSIAKARS